MVFLDEDQANFILRVSSLSQASQLNSSLNQYVHQPKMEAASRIPTRSLMKTLDYKNLCT